MSIIQTIAPEIKIDAVELFSNFAIDAAAQAVSNSTEIVVEFNPIKSFVQGELTHEDVAQCVENLLTYLFVNSGSLLDVLETFPESHEDVKEYFLLLDKLEKGQALSASELASIAVDQ